MNPTLPFLAALLLAPLAALCAAADTATDRIAIVMNTPVCVAFWDFVNPYQKVGFQIASLLGNH